MIGLMTRFEISYGECDPTLDASHVRSHICARSTLTLTLTRLKNTPSLSFGFPRRCVSKRNSPPTCPVRVAGASSRKLVLEYQPAKIIKNGPSTLLHTLPFCIYNRLTGASTRRHNTLWVGRKTRQSKNPTGIHHTRVVSLGHCFWARTTK